MKVLVWVLWTKWNRRLPIVRWWHPSKLRSSWKSKLKLLVEINLTNLTDHGFVLGLFADGASLHNEWVNGLVHHCHCCCSFAVDSCNGDLLPPIGHSLIRGRQWKRRWWISRLLIDDFILLWLTKFYIPNSSQTLISISHFCVRLSVVQSIWWSLYFKIIYEHHSRSSLKFWIWFLAQYR